MRFAHGIVFAFSLLALPIGACSESRPSAPDVSADAARDVDPDVASPLRDAGADGSPAPDADGSRDDGEPGPSADGSTDAGNRFAAVDALARQALASGAAPGFSLTVYLGSGLFAFQ